MNPSILLPELRDRPWFCVRWPKPKESIVCACHKRQLVAAANASPTKKATANVPVLKFKMMRFNADTGDGGNIAGNLGVAQCSLCGAIHWTSDTLFEIIKLVEMKELEQC